GPARAVRAPGGVSPCAGAARPRGGPAGYPSLMAAAGSVPQSLKETIKEKIATALKDNLKLEEKEFVNPWSNQDKASVLQQTRCFSDTPIDSEKCMQLITRVLYLLQQGEKFTSQELTDLFFGCTKLFQVSSTRLRRMVFLVIKELEPPDEIAFIVASSLIKDAHARRACALASPPFSF
ncbi:unnamed protein product, partial [Prorocentrum cordatum]